MDVKNLIEYLRKNNGSSLIVSDEGKIYYRANAKIFSLDIPNLTSEEVANLVKSVITKDKYENFINSKNLNFTVNFSEDRLNIKGFWGIKGPFFILTPISKIIPKIEELNLPKIAKNFFNAKKGLMLICGPEDEKNNLVISCLINYVINNLNKYILTIEQPVNHLFNSDRSIIHQQESMNDLEFENILKKSFDHNVDLIYIDKIREKKVAQLLLDNSSSNLLIIASIRANSTLYAIEKFLNFFSSEEKIYIRTRLSEMLELIIYVTSINKINESSSINIFEVLYNNKIVKNLIKDGNLSQIYEQMRQDENMITLQDSIQELLDQKLINSQEFDKIINTQSSENWIKNKKLENF